MRTLVAAFALLATGSCLAATLHARDLNGDGQTDAYFDSVQNVTWLADADYAYTSGYSFTSTPWEGYHHITGEWLGMSLGTANTWAASLNYHGTTGWRLPTLVQTCEPPDPLLPSLVCSYVGELQSLFGRLAGTTIANFPPPASIAGGNFFQYGNMVLCPMPTHTTDCMAAESTTHGLLLSSETTYGLASWAVRDGDVSPVPEPTTVGLLLGGLMALAAYRRRHT